ncbi:MAG: VWA domain-containing protein, partial [Planctomycetes bacterium]|nr:VWA domain-containing protein [Planctomycetota bacterium]
EQGRLQKRLGEVLWRLTAQPFETDAGKWQAWWAGAAGQFTVVTEKELDQAAAARERRRLTQRTVAQSKFFGIKVESQRVIFVLDVSGSMLESMYGRTVGKRPASRIDVAKEELALAIKNLEAGALFNVLTFSNGVARWQKEGIGVNTQQSRNEALAWVERLGAAGGTNLYDAVKEAFADKDVDTIFVLSDGEPTAGEQIDPYRIREDIAAWNRHRRVKIHTIAVGGSLEVLEWLALDSGGRYLQMR